MQDSAKVAICRLICGTALIVVRAVTGYDGTLTAISLFLLGVPVEYLQVAKSEGSSQ